MFKLHFGHNLLDYLPEEFKFLTGQIYNPKNRIVLHRDLAHLKKKLNSWIHISISHKYLNTFNKNVFWRLLNRKSQSDVGLQFCNSIPSPMKAGGQCFLAAPVLIALGQSTCGALTFQDLVGWHGKSPQSMSAVHRGMANALLGFGWKLN